MLTNKKPVVAGLVLIILLICVLSLLYLTEKHRRTLKILFPSAALGLSQSKNTCSKLCVSKHCVYTAADVAHYMESRYEPCADFYQHVCGAYMPTNPRAASVPMEMNLNFLANIKNMLDSLEVERLEKIPASIFLEVKKVFKNCMSDTTYSSYNSKKTVMKLLSHLEASDWPNLPSSWTFAAGNVVEFLSTFSVMGEDSLIEIKRLNIIPCAQNHPSTANCSKIMEVTVAESRLILDFSTYLTNDSSSIRLLREYENMITSLLELYRLHDKPAAEFVSDILVLEKRFAKLFNESKSRFLLRHEQKKPLDERLFEQHYNLTARLLPFVRRSLEKADIHIKPENIQINVRDMRLMDQLLIMLDNIPPRTLSNYLILRFLLNHVYHLGFFVRSTLLQNEVYRKMDRYPDVKEKWEGCVSWVLEKFTPLVGYIYELQYFDQSQAFQAKIVYKQLKATFIDIIKSISYFNPEYTNYLENKILQTKLYVSRYENTTFPLALSQRYQDMHFSGEIFLENVLEYNAHAWKYLVKSVYFEFEKSRFNHILGVNALAREDSISCGIGFMQYPLLGEMRPLHVDIAKIGQILAHEIGHVFHMALEDYTNITATVRDGLIKFHQCLSSYYNRYPLPGNSSFKVDGNGTFDENFADLISLHVTFLAYKNLIEEVKLPIPAELKITYLQLFFMLFSQTFCELPGVYGYKTFLRDPHSPLKYRANGPLSNFQGFTESYRCEVGSSMNSVKQCTFVNAD